MKTLEFECLNCHKKSESSSVPSCCGEEMKEVLNTCTTAPHAEMVRNTDEDEPCDDGRN